jgi:acyl-CoA dehydrogenase
VWDFKTDPEYQQKLDWADEFVREKIEPLDLAYPEGVFEETDERLLRYVDSLKDEVRKHGLWACHLEPDLGGQGYGQLKLALLNEILGRSKGEHNLGWGPILFGTNAPDTGNAEIIAHYGTDAQKERYLQPLLDGKLFSAFAMTEPQAGADPGEFETRASREGDEWVIDGEKFFISNARFAAFFVVMAITDPDVPVIKGSSMFLVPTETPGIEILRNLNTGPGDAGDGTHAHMRFDRVRVPADHLLGEVGRGFEIAQTRLSGGRLHHAMRTIAICRQALDMMGERALSRRTKGELLADKQATQEAIADCYMELEQFRLFVLRTAWRIDEEGYQAARGDISASKVIAARVVQNVVGRAMHLHGALGTATDLPFTRMWRQVPWMGIHDGPTEVQIGVLARSILRGYSPAEGSWPSAYLPPLIEAATAKVAAQLAEFEAAPSTS